MTVSVKLSYLISLCSLPLCGSICTDFTFSISTARSSHIFAHRKSSTFWALCHNSGTYPLTYIGVLWKARLRARADFSSVCFPCPWDNLPQLFHSQSLGLAGCLFIPCRNPLSGGCWGGCSHNERYDRRGLLLLLFPDSWREVMPAGKCFAFAYLFNAKLHPPSWFTPHTLILSLSRR